MTIETLGADSAPVTPSTPKADLRAATASLIQACSNEMFSDKYKWDSLLNQWNAVDTICRLRHPDFNIDELGSIADDLQVALMATPSPDAEALRWKLDYFLAPIGGGSTDSYPPDFVAQTVADYRRLLGSIGADTAIEAAWARRQAAFLRYKALPLDKPPPGETETPAEQACLAIVDEAEEVIRSHVAHTPHGAAIQLKVALYSFLSQRPHEEALTRGDLDALEAGELDWPERLVLAALRSLEAQAASCNTSNAGEV